MSDTDWGNLAMGLGTLVIVGAIANKMINNKPSKNTGLFGEQMPKQPKQERMKWGW